MTIEEQVDKALNMDLDLTDEEIKKKFETADNITDKHGVVGKAPVSESKRLRRMTMNYYGTMLNVCANMLAGINSLEKMIYEQNLMLASLYKKVMSEETEGTNGQSRI